MAGSRLQNFGTIFSRTTGLLQAGAIKEAPIWYNVYKKYPPVLEPNSDRPAPPQDPVPEIVYEEDFERAKLAQNMVGDRIGLNYNIRRREATESYVAQHDRLELGSLKNSYYALDEKRTKSRAGNKKQEITKRTIPLVVKNPIKLNSKVRKHLYRLTPEEKQRLMYSDFQKINKLWTEYAQTVLGHNDVLNAFRMDLHGSHMTCTASKNPSFVGMEGFVLQDTKNTFLLVTKTNRLVTVPKKESIFELNVAEKRYRVHGCNFLFTIQSRTKIKYKQPRSRSNV